MRRYFASLLLVAVTSSCETSITRRNDADDMSRGMDLVREFYREIQAGRFEEATHFISASDLPKEDALKLLTTIKSMRGVSWSGKTGQAKGKGDMEMYFVSN